MRTITVDLEKLNLEQLKAYILLEEANLKRICKEIEEQNKGWIELKEQPRRKRIKWL